MSKAINSPTARLLQSSRLFSLPRPLPQPALETITSTGLFRASDTATLPYPTHQAVATPASSHFRGDWGLKRALPRRATKDTSTPHIRVNAQDTTEHITDFESAADHTRTEAKWQAMGIPVITKATRSTVTNYNTAPQSVYDEEVDNTNPNAVGTFATPINPRSGNGKGAKAMEPRVVTKWKYDGPWIAGMDEGEFQKYLETKIAPRSEAFRQFLFDRFVERHVSENRRAGRAQGQTFSAEKIQNLRDEFATKFEEEEKRLRHDHMHNQLSSEITAAICDFLDLPSVRPTRVDDAFSGMANTSALRDKLSSFAPTDSSGPPSTHPGAGLSHIRTNLVMANHPLYGPQAHRPPVLARVVRPRTNAQGTEFQAKIGVGGVVANDSVSSAYQVDRRNRNHSANKDEDTKYLEADSMVQVIDPDCTRGNHIWVHPGQAHVDDTGRIRLDISRGDQEAIAVQRNKVEPILEARRAIRRPLMPNTAPRGTADNANYGTSLPDLRQAAQKSAPQSRVRGFDEELGRTSKQDGMNDSDATAKIRSLLANEGARPKRAR